MDIRIAARALAALALAGLLPQAAAAATTDARALTDSGQVLTVGSWAIATLDGGIDVRVADERVLGWELRDGDGVLLQQGMVPGSESLGIDGHPALSRSPLTGEIWLAWSRQASEGAAREIALTRFGGGSWVAGSLATLASDVDDQFSPALLHDDAGTAYLAWVDGLDDRDIRFLAVAADGRILGSATLSQDLSERNGPPSIGIDAIGQIFVAHAGTPVAGGDVTLFVHATSPRLGGVSHLPDPFIELGVRASLPTPSMSLTPDDPQAIPSRVQLTVLGGTPVAWWTENAGNRPARFRYVAESESGWTASEIRTIDLSSGMVATVPDALALIEARLRRVLAQSTIELPVVDQPVLGGFGRVLTRR